MKNVTMSLVLFLCSGHVQPSVWDADNDPAKLDRDFSAYFVSLPLAGEILDSRKGWPTSHWPDFTGGIAYRWSSADPRPFKYKTLTLAQLKKTAPNIINELSPAEKYDIYRRDYSYSLTRHVLKKNSPNENQWHGLCHGTAPASMNHHEPKLVSLTNGDGFTVKFYSSDVSALMAHYYGTVSRSKVVLVGKRCYSKPNSFSCEDLNAGSFHIILANRLGLTGESFIADIEQKHEVWNHVAVRYLSLLMGYYPPVEDSAPGTVRRVRMETMVTYAAAIAPKFYPVIGTPDAMYADNTYEYYLELDNDGRIIGGEWIGERRPDFVWTKAASSFTGTWATLNEIYRPVD